MRLRAHFAWHVLTVFVFVGSASADDTVRLMLKLDPDGPGTFHITASAGI